VPVTEDELRAMLRDRTASVPATPDLVGRVQQRVRRRRRQELAAGAVAVVAVLVGAALVVIPRPDATAPVGPTPTPSPSTGRTIVTGPQSLGDLDVTTQGPLAITGTAPFVVTVTVHNTGARAWTGTPAVGLVHRSTFPGWFDGRLVTVSAGTSGASDIGATLPDMALAGGTPAARAFDGVTLDHDVTVPAGATRSWSFTVERDPMTAVPADVVGWVPSVADSTPGSSVFGDIDVASPVAVAPAGSSLPCAAVSISSTSTRASTSWQLSEVATSVVGSDGVARWSDVGGLTPQPMGLTSTAGTDARPTTIALAVSDAGAGRPSAYGPASAARPAHLAPGRYVTYGAYTLVPILFEGTCSPSGESISGQWTSYDQVGTGIVTCSTDPPPGSVGALVKQRYCPR
jgi:hypothetical protein